MTIIDLTDPHEEHRKDPARPGIKVTTYPDGQRDLRLMHPTQPGPYKINVRARNFSDLELVIMAKRALDCEGLGKDVTLFMPYIPGARSDRRFAEGGVRYLTDVIAPIVNSLEFSRVVALDPHSDVSENVIHRLHKKPFHALFRDVLTGFDRPILVSPDAGAVKKVQETAREVGAHCVLSATKSRDVLTGHITGTFMPSTDHDGDLVVCDDIIDGGRTFVELAKAARKAAPAARIHLVVTHCILSNKELAKDLFNAYASVHTTDSFRKVTKEEEALAAVCGCMLRQKGCF